MMWLEIMPCPSTQEAKGLLKESVQLANKKNKKRMMWFEIKPCKSLGRIYTNPDAEVGNLTMPCQQPARSEPKELWENKRRTEGGEGKCNKLCPNTKPNHEYIKNPKQKHGMI